jgi:2-haloacid dehalogenase
MAIRGVCFDLFTLFDPRSVVQVAAEHVPDAPAFCEAWRARQFQYAFLRAAGDRYVDFRTVTEVALAFAAKQQGLSLADDARRRLADAYSELALWPDARETLLALRAAGLRLAPLANYAPAMIDALFAHAGIEDLFDARISTDAARTYKPDPKAYALGPAALELPREAIVFAAFGGWDAAGAKWFGFPTVWINRLGVPAEELDPAPDATGATLAALTGFLSDHSRLERAPSG